MAALVEMLKDSSAPVKTSATRALGAMQKAAATAVPALVPLLQDRDESVRTAAAEAIAQVGPLDQAATDALVVGLDSLDNVVRAQTAEALGTIGAAAEEAAPALVEAMADDNDRVRAMAVEALGKIGESAAGVAIPGLMRALRDQDNGVSALAAEALGQMGESADGAIPALVRSLSHLNAEVRRNAAEALGKMGGTAAGARAALENTACDEDGGVRSEAIRALGALGLPTPQSTRVVASAFRDPDPLVRAAAVESLGQWGEPSEGDLDDLIRLLEDANDQVKVEVTKALPKLAGATPEVIDGLCRRLLEDDSEWVQVSSALALGQLGRAAGVAGGPLLHAVQNGVVSVREQAMRAIAKIQPPETAEAFTAGLKDACGDVRMVASAGWMNATAITEQAIPALVEALGDPEVRVRANCARPGPARRHSRGGHPPARRVHARCRRRPSNERGDGAQARSGRHGRRGDAAPGRGLELARALDRRELTALRGIEQLERGRRTGGGPGRPGPASPRGGARTGRVPRCIGRGSRARLDERRRISRGARDDRESPAASGRASGRWRHAMR